MLAKDPLILTPQRGNRQFNVENAVQLLHRLLVGTKKWRGWCAGLLTPMFQSHALLRIFAGRLQERTGVGQQREAVSTGAHAKGRGRALHAAYRRFAAEIISCMTRT